MRHRVFGKKLGRDPAHRKAMLTNLARSFFINNGQLKSSQAKIQACRRLIEKMICQAGKGDLASRRWLYKFFPDQTFVNRIVKDFGQQFASRHGGYTRVVLVKRCRGDNSILARLELVEPLVSLAVVEDKSKGKKGEKGKETKELTKKSKKAEKKSQPKANVVSSAVVTEKTVGSRMQRLGKIIQPVVKKRGDK
ncbi:MAG: 50S ribosomal protein L17 [Patescibacteria group bacterium]